MSLTDELDLAAAFIHDPCIGTPVDLLEDSNEQIVTQGCVRLLTAAITYRPTASAAPLRAGQVDCHVRQHTTS
jgi:hypothetical protein